MLLRTLFLCSPILFCASGAFGQSIRVVDAANGPGTDFTSLPAAVLAAVSGDVFLVRPGSYAPFWVSGKDLHIFGAGPDVCFIEGPTVGPSITEDYVRIENVPAGKTFDLTGFTIRATGMDLNYITALGTTTPLDVEPAIAALAVRGATGTTVVADVETEPSASAPPFPNVPGGLLVDGADVHSHRCRWTGGVLYSLGNARIFGTPGATVRNGAVLVATNCSFEGPFIAVSVSYGSLNCIAGTGLIVRQSGAALHGCSLSGGSASATIGGLPAFSSAIAVGGNALRAKSGALVRISASSTDSIIGGGATAAVTGNYVWTGTASGPGFAIRTDDGGAVVVHGDPTMISPPQNPGYPTILNLGSATLGQPELPRLSTSGVAVNGGEWDATQSVTLSLTCPLPNAPFVLLLDIYPGFSTPLPGLQLGELLLSAVGGFIVGGELDATGAFSVSVVPILLAPGAANVPLHLQAAVADFGAGHWRLSNAETRIFRN